METATMELYRVKKKMVHFLQEDIRDKTIPICGISITRGSWEAGGRPTRISVRIDALPDKD